MRKHLSVVLFLLFFLFQIQAGTAATLKILLVDDDNYSSPDHLPLIEQAITDAGYSYDLFNAQDSARSPDAALMSKYNLVFWYNANDGVGGYFWSGKDTVNTEIVNYLNNGGWMWIMGNDIIYDMYGGAPDTFQVGDVLYDYFGLQSYDAQSKKDDGGKGVPLLYLDKENAPQGMFAVDTLSWKYSALWYVDALTPVEGARVIYRMGPDDYALAGSPTMISYQTADFLTVTSAFNPRQFKENNHYCMLHLFLADGLNWMQNQVLTTIGEAASAVPRDFTVYQNFPNPFNPTTSVPIALPSAGKVQLTLYNVLGQKVWQQNYRLNAGMHLLVVNGQNLASGVYFYKVKFKDAVLTRKMILLK